MTDFGKRLQKLEAKRAPRKSSGLPPLRRKFLTDSAVLNGDQEALRELSLHPTASPGSSEQRAAALATGLRADT